MNCIDSDIIIGHSLLCCERFIQSLMAFGCIVFIASCCKGEPISMTQIATLFSSRTCGASVSCILPIPLFLGTGALWIKIL